MEHVWPTAKKLEGNDQRPEMAEFNESVISNQNTQKTKIPDKKTQKGNKPFSCTYCDKKMRNPSELQIHERIHTGEKPFACKHCDKKFKTSGELKGHEWIHTGEKPFACKYCDKKLNQSGDLQKHERIHTQLAANPLLANVVIKN